MTPLSSIPIHRDDLFQAQPSAELKSGKSGSEEDARVTARLEVTGKALGAFLMAYNQEPPIGKQKEALILTWATALKKIPVEQILPLAQAELCERDSPFMPVPADLVKRWNKSAMTPSGAGNVAAYLPYMPSQRPALPAPLPPLQIDPQELKRRLGMPVPPPVSWPKSQREEEPSLLPTTGQRWSESLREVADAGNIDLERCSPQQILELGKFSRWWLENHPCEALATYGFADGYRQFCETK